MLRILVGAHHFSVQGLDVPRVAYGVGYHHSLGDGLLRDAVDILVLDAARHSEIPCL